MNINQKMESLFKQITDNSLKSIGSADEKSEMLRTVMIVNAIGELTAEVNRLADKFAPKEDE